jgi:hypothetical protein
MAVEPVLHHWYALARYSAISARVTAMAGEYWGPAVTGSKSASMMPELVMRSDELKKKSFSVASVNTRSAIPFVARPRSAPASVTPISYRPALAAPKGVRIPEIDVDVDEVMLKEPPDCVSRSKNTVPGSKSVPPIRKEPPVHRFTNPGLTDETRLAAVSVVNEETGEEEAPAEPQPG